MARNIMRAVDAKHLTIQVSVFCQFPITKKLVDEIRRVKNLKGKLPPWYVDFRPPNQLWDEDQIEKIPGVGKKVASSLYAIGVDTMSINY